MERTYTLIQRSMQEDVNVWDPYERRGSCHVAIVRIDVSLVWTDQDR